MKPTITPHVGFSMAEDARTLKEAMKGSDTDEDAIIGILTSRSNSQRQQIAKFFKEELGGDLIEDLKSKLGGHLEDLIVALVLPPDEYLSQQLNKAMYCMSEDLTEIICSQSTIDMKRIVETYKRVYERPLTEHMLTEIGGDVRYLLTLIVTGSRDDSKETNQTEAREKAEALHADGEADLGIPDSKFSSVLANENSKQLQLIFKEYKDISGKTIQEALNCEVYGDYYEALLAIMENLQNPPAYFATRLHKAMNDDEDDGTKDRVLIRVVVSRSEIDLEDIKSEFEKLYNKTLSSYIDGRTGGDYKKALLAIIK